MTIKRLGQNKWLIRFSTGGRNDRKYHRKTFHGTLSQAKEAELEMMLEAQSPLVPRSALTLKNFTFSNWLPNADISGVTREIYKRHMAKVCERLGDIALRDLRVQHLEHYFNSRTPPGMARKEFETLRTALNVALRWQYITVNPCTLMQAPRKPRKRPPEVYSEQEVSTIAELIQGQWFEPLWLLGIFCGLRPEESTALDVPPRDWDGMLRIERAYSHQGSEEGWVLTKTKTDASSDTVFVPREIAVRILDITEGRMGPLGSQPYMPEGYRANRMAFNKAYRRFCTNCNVRYIPPKNFRHTAATLMLKGGVDLSVVSKVLRHTQVSTTANAYLGIIEGAKKEATEKLFESISRSAQAAHQSSEQRTSSAQNRTIAESIGNKKQVKKHI